MKKQFIYLALAAIVLCFAACDEEVEQTPKDRTIPELVKALRVIPADEAIEILTANGYQELSTNAQGEKEFAQGQVLGMNYFNIDVYEHYILIKFNADNKVINARATCYYAEKSSAIWAFRKWYGDVYDMYCLQPRGQNALMCSIYSDQWSFYYEPQQEGAGYNAFSKYVDGAMGFGEAGITYKGKDGVPDETLPEHGYNGTWFGVSYQSSTVGNEFPSVSYHWALMNIDTLNW